mgnify:CR=1 FL=1
MIINLLRRFYAFLITFHFNLSHKKGYFTSLNNQTIIFVV